MDRGIVAVGFLFGVFFVLGVIVAIVEKYADKNIDKIFKNRGQNDE
jgi:hypothetical protein